MDLNKLYSPKRTGRAEQPEAHEHRSSYRRDFDRIVFSSAFRRLQNKTQVFPLPGSIFVHNRLTHSLEVSSVGRSLGALAGYFIKNKFAKTLTDESKIFYEYNLPDVTAAACLCHDIGNPAFGHSGEDAIAEYFKSEESSLRKHFSDGEWADFINFEGNANAVRCLASEQKGKEHGGLGLTCTTLASIIKYPCPSSKIDRKILRSRKFGYLCADKHIFDMITAAAGMKRIDEESCLRHPFVWLVEAADDICYNIIDLEDAHRLRIIEHDECVGVLCSLVEDLSPDTITEIKDRLYKIEDKNTKISYLRAKSISSLTMRTIELFSAQIDKILDGSPDTSLYDMIRNEVRSLKEIETFSLSNIYNHRSVVEIENAGYNIMHGLLGHFVPAILKNAPDRRKIEQKALELIPKQFIFDTESKYMRVLGVIDYISGMTDNYAIDLYKKIKGIDPGLTNLTIAFSK